MHDPRYYILKVLRENLDVANVQLTDKITHQTQPPISQRKTQNYILFINSKLYGLNRIH